MIELLSMPFMQRALIAAAVVGVVAGFYGAFVVQRGLSFMGSGLAHAAFGGVALGLLLNKEPMWIALVFTAVTAVGIVWLSDRADLGGDAAVGIFFAVAMALGVVFLSFRDNYATDAFSYLFGSILAVEKRDLWAIGLLALSLIAAAPLWPQWAYATFDRDLAASDRIAIKRHDYLLAVFIAVTVVAAVKVVGIVLIGSFLVIPAAAARLASRSFAAMTVLSMAIGLLTAVAGIFASWQFDLPAGPSIILVQAALFLILLPFKR